MLPAVHWRSLVWGFCGTLGCLLILLLLWLTVVGWTRAYNGQLAYEYILKIQQEQAKPSSSPPAPVPSTPK
jgi:uncharacterized Tic20 family protein